MHKSSVEAKFRWRIAVGFSVTLGAGIFIACASWFGLRSIAATQDLLLFDHVQDVIVAQQLRNASEKMVSSSRSFLITGDHRFLLQMGSAQTAFDSDLASLYRNGPGQDDRAALDAIARAEADYEKALHDIIPLREKGIPQAKLIAVFEKDLLPRRQEFDRAISELVAGQKKTLEGQKMESRDLGRRSVLLVGTAGGLALILTGTLAFILARTLTRLFAEARKATRLRDDMIAVVSHDLKNPIAAIRLSIELLKRPGVTGDSVRVSAGRIENATGRMYALITDLLDLAKLEAGSLILEPRDVSAEELVKDTLEGLVPIAEKKRITVDTKCDERLRLWCDPARIGQVISNLAANAIKFSKEGEAIAVDVHENNEQVCITVKDSGPGISARDRERIFNRFWQAKETAAKGTGLGLSIAKGFVEAHGGRIWVESAPGEGSAFRFTLPKAGMARLCAG